MSGSNSNFDKLDVEIYSFQRETCPLQSATLLATSVSVSVSSNQFLAVFAATSSLYLPLNNCYYSGSCCHSLSSHDCRHRKLK